jgi:LacI family transcriptional regulator
MRERVNAAIDQLAYRPRIAARAMRGSTYTIGFEIPELANQFFSRVLSGASSALSETNYQMMLAPANSDPYESRAVEALVDHQVDGFIAIAPLVDREWLENIARRVPVVMFGRHDESDFYDSVASDDRLGTAAAMQHLFSLGHDSVMHLTIADTLTRPFTPHGVRLHGYEEAMDASGRSAFMEVLRTGPGQDPYQTVLQRLSRPPWPSALFAAHDELAIGAMQALQELGLDISVIGYDDVPIAAHPLVSLSTMDQHGEAMGARAIELLVERIKGRTTPVHDVFEPTLRARASTRASATARRRRAVS